MSTWAMLGSVLDAYVSSHLILQHLQEAGPIPWSVFPRTARVHILEALKIDQAGVILTRINETAKMGNSQPWAHCGKGETGLAGA